MATNDDLVTLINSLRTDFAKANEDLRRDIKEDNSKLSKNIKAEIDNLTNKVNDNKKTADRRNDEERARSDRINKRLADMEASLKKTNEKVDKVDRTKYRETLRKEEEERVRQFRKDTGMKDTEDEINEKQIEAEKEKNSEEMTWADRMNKDMEEAANSSRGRQRKPGTEDDKNEKTTKIKKKPGKMGNSIDASDLHDLQDWGWNESRQEWHGTIERVEENERKKTEMKEKKKRIQTETATKASLIVGLHPISQQSIDKFNTITGDYTDAKVEAAKEYLINYLGFDINDFDNFRITDTQTSNKNDEVLYISVDEQDIIREIHRRVAERKNPDIYVRNYVPPPIFHQILCTKQNLQRMERQ